VTVIFAPISCLLLLTSVWTFVIIHSYSEVTQSHKRSSVNANLLKTVGYEEKDLPLPLQAATGETSKPSSQIRSACHYGRDDPTDWTSRVSRIFFLGTPQLGAPLEKFVNVLTASLKIVNPLPCGPWRTFSISEARPFLHEPRTPQACRTNIVASFPVRIILRFPGTLPKLKDLVQDNIDKGATSAEQAHKAIAAMPFEALEKIEPPGIRGQVNPKEPRGDKNEIGRTDTQRK
jgi:hypothetical protein